MRNAWPPILQLASPHEARMTFGQRLGHVLVLTQPLHDLDIVGGTLRRRVQEGRLGLPSQSVTGSMTPPYPWTRRALDTFAVDRWEVLYAVSHSPGHRPHPFESFDIPPESRIRAPTIIIAVSTNADRPRRLQVSR